MVAAARLFVCLTLGFRYGHMDDHTAFVGSQWPQFLSTNRIHIFCPSIMSSFVS